MPPRRWMAALSAGIGPRRWCIATSPHRLQMLGPLLQHVCECLDAGGIAEGGQRQSKSPRQVAEVNVNASCGTEPFEEVRRRIGADPRLPLLELIRRHDERR